MPLASGTRLGAYIIDTLIGAGGMGEVYKAHDPRLGRHVAIKVLPQSISIDPERQARFEQEARATGGLNHPNVLAVYDVGSQNGSPYLVSELLDGQTLRDRLAESPLPLRKALELAGQIASGLAAAHARGIIHRDLKPENVFVTRDGRAKILDFGLAKLTARDPVSNGATVSADAKVAATAEGVVMGTVGYMAPEQVRGAAVDHRSDLFSFGAVLYEMAAGRRAFQRETAVETLSAILKEEPDSPAPDRPLPPGLDRIIRRCLEKSPDERFESARDIAFALDAVSTASGPSTALASVVEAPARGGRHYVAAVPLVLAGLLIGATGVWLLRAPRQAHPTFEPITYSRGFLRVARFTADGQTIVHGGRWNGPDLKVWFQRHDAPLFSPLPIPDADLLDVSSTSELAIALRRRQEGMQMLLGTLARVPMSGGAPRELVEDVLDADWSPDGSELAIIRRAGGRVRLEYPIGKVLYETPGYLSDVRFSPAGDLMAFMDHPFQDDDRGTVVVVDQAGTRRIQSREWETEQGLAWSPDGREVWFGTAADVRAIDLSGRDRLILQAPGSVRVQDIAADGRLLLALNSIETAMRLGSTGTGGSRDVSWLTYSWDHDVAPDGSFVVYNALPTGGTNYTLYLQRSDGQPPVLLGQGRPLAISPDSKAIVATLLTNDLTIVVIPTGAGETQRYNSERLHYRDAFWLPGSRLLVSAFETGGRPRTFLQDLSGAGLKPLTPEGIVPIAVSPDGTTFLARDQTGSVTAHSTSTGAPSDLLGLVPGDEVVQWVNGRVLVASPGPPFTIRAVDPVTGARSEWRQFPDIDPAGLYGVPRLRVTPDGAHYLLAVDRRFVTMFVVRGAR